LIEALPTKQHFSNPLAAFAERELILMVIKQILFNTGWLMADRVLRMAGGVFVNVWIARYLGPEQFGLLSYAIALVAIFAIVATLGFNKIIVRELVQQQQQKNVIIGTAFLLRITTSCLIVGVAYLVSSLFDIGNPKTPLLVVIIAIGIIFQSFDCIELFFQSQVKSKYAVLVKSSSFLLTTGIKIILILVNASVEAFAVVALVEVMLSAIGLAFIYQTLGNSLRLWRFKVSVALNLLTESWPEILAGFSVLLCMRMDQIMLGQMLGTNAVGIYTAASRLSDVWYFLPMAIVNSALPAIVAAKKSDETLYYRRLQQLLSGLVLLSYLIALSTTFLAHFLILLLYGNEFELATKVLIIHIWTTIAVSLGTASGSWIIAEKKVKLNFYRALLGAVLNVVLNWILIRQYGEVGAALATLLSLIIAFYLFDLFSSQMRRMFVMKTKALFVIGLVDF
jgi:PST family polysaccharide transporter